jgi:uncharacterized protein (PEP-CTERM system associated)
MRSRRESQLGRRLLLVSGARLFWTLVPGVLVPVVPAMAQTSGFSLTPRFTATQQFTDNRTLSASNPQAESITTISPGVSITSRIPGLSGSLDYAPSYVHFARGTGVSGFRDGLRNALQSDFRGDAFDNRLTFSAGAAITTQSVSALGLQGERPNDINPNSTELRTLRGSVVAREFLPGRIDVQARLSGSLSRSVDSLAGDASAQGLGLQASQRLGAAIWTLSWERARNSFRDGRSSTSDRAGLRLAYQFTPVLQAFATAGQDRDDVVQADVRSTTTYGGGLTWAPTSRTSLGLQAERRFFGNSFGVNASHRLRRATFTYADNRSVVESTAGAGQAVTLYQLFFAQFASLEPDPVLRDVLVRDFLRNAGLNPNERLTGGFLNTSLVVQRARNLNVAWQARRQTVVLSAFATTSERADRTAGGADDLSRVSLLRQRGMNLSLSHRLTPTSSVVFSASRSSTPGANGVAGNGLRVFTLGWGEQVTRRTALSVSARSARATGPNAYDENSLLATLNLSF